MAPYYVWQKPRPRPSYRHEEMSEFLSDLTSSMYYSQIHSPYRFLPRTLFKAVGRDLLFYRFRAWFLHLLMLPWALVDRRIRFLVLCPLSSRLEWRLRSSLPALPCAFTAAFYAVGLQRMRHLQALATWGTDGWHGDRPLSCSSVSCMAGIATIRSTLQCPRFPRAGIYLDLSIGLDRTISAPSADRGTRARADTRANNLPSSAMRLTMIRIDEWVYNAADIDRSKVIWARDMGEGKQPGTDPLLSRTESYGWFSRI